MTREKVAIGALIKEAADYVGRALSRIPGKNRPIFWLCQLIYTLQNGVFLTLTNYLVSQVVAAAAAQSMAALGQGILFFMSAFVIFLFCLCMAVYWLLNHQTRLLNDILDTAYDRLMHAPLAQLGKAGEAFSRLENDVPAAAQMGGMNLTGMVLMQPMTGLFSCIVIAAIHPLLAVVALMGGVVSLITELSMVKPNRQANDEIRRLQAEKTVLMDDMISGGLTIRLFNRQATMNRNLWESLLAIAKAQMKTYKLGMLSALGGGVSEWLAMAGVAGVGLWLAMKGEITLAQVVMVMGMASSAKLLVSSPGACLNSLQRLVAGAKRAYEVIDGEIEDPRADAGKPAPDSSAPQLTVENITFGYDAQSRTLEQVSFSVEKGETLALVGESGSGKSTMLKLMMNLYHPGEGEICVQGIPMGSMTLDDWRRRFAYVPQSSPLFDGTIADNIALGREGATRTEIEAAAKAAYAHDFIMALPQGYETPVGEGATMISGGQRQRIAIARAILRDAPILLLDEATSSLDTQSEREVQAALERLMEGRATVVVAHRLSTIQKADTILVLEEGRMAEQGNHKDLLKAGGHYAAMVQAGSIA